MHRLLSRVLCILLVTLKNLLFFLELLLLSFQSLRTLSHRQIRKMLFKMNPMVLCSVHLQYQIDQFLRSFPHQRRSFSWAQAS
jgi:hypothetical protein